MRNEMCSHNGADGHTTMLMEKHVPKFFKRLISVIDGQEHEVRSLLHVLLVLRLRLLLLCLRVRLRVPCLLLQLRLVVTIQYLNVQFDLPTHMLIQYLPKKKSSTLHKTASEHCWEWQFGNERSTRPGSARTLKIAWHDRDTHWQLPEIPCCPIYL